MSDRVFSRAVLGVVVLATATNFVALPTGRESTIVLSLAFAALLCGFWMLHVLRGDQAVNRGVVLPVAAFVCAGTFSWIWSKLTADVLLWIWPSFPMVQLAALLVNSLLPMMLLVTASVILNELWVERFVLLLVCVGLANLAARIFGVPIGAALENGTRGLFVAWSSGAAAMLLLYRWRTTAPWMRAAASAVLGGNVYHYFVVHRLWMSGWLPMLAALFAIAWMRSRIFGACVTLCVVVVGMMYMDDLYRSIVLDNINEGGMQRFELWAMNLQHVANHPVFGLGPAGYAPYNMTYHPRDARSTHNNYFDVLAQTGVVGMACFLWLLFAVLRKAWSMHAASPPGSFARGYAALTFAVLLSALGAMMLGDWVLPFAYNQSITGFDNAVISWVGWGMVWALSKSSGAAQSGAAKKL